MQPISKLVKHSGIDEEFGVDWHVSERYKKVRVPGGCQVQQWQASPDIMQVEQHQMQHSAGCAQGATEALAYLTDMTTLHCSSA